VVVLDSDDLAADPVATLMELCRRLGVPYEESMVSWESGPHACDGPWAEWWYEDAHRSTGWKVRPAGEGKVVGASRYRTLDPALLPALKASMPAYDFLKGLSITRRAEGGVARMPGDPRNADLLVWVGTRGGGRLVPRDLARVSPWDYSVQHGEAAQEVLRVYQGRVFLLGEHVDALQQRAESLLAFQRVHSKDEIVEAVFRALAANGMRDQACLRLVLTRGDGYAFGMNPPAFSAGANLIVLPEWNSVGDGSSGISLTIVAQGPQSRSGVDGRDGSAHAKAVADRLGAADAIIIDTAGIVTGTSGDVVFCVHSGTLSTPPLESPGARITCKTIEVIAKEHNIPWTAKKLSLDKLITAEEVFCVGPINEIRSVVSIDGPGILHKAVSYSLGPIAQQLSGSYRKLPERSDMSTELPMYNR